MEHYAGIDYHFESASLCVVDAIGRIVREAKVVSEPEILIGWFHSLELAMTRIGLEAGPLSQWLYAGMWDAGLPVELLEIRHVRDAFKAMPVKTDRNDARGIAQLMRLGWFRPVHCKSLAAQETRALSSRPSSSPLLTSCVCTSAPRSTRCGPSRGSRRRARCPRKAPTWASRRASSRSGSAAPDATTSGRCRGSATPTPTRSAPTWRSSPTRTALDAVGSGPARRAASAREPAVPAQHLLTCTNGHLDEFPYTLWVHRGGKCLKAELPDLKMRDANVGKSVGSTIICAFCGATRGMAEAQGVARTRQAAAAVQRPPPTPERL